jgi:DNA (cytosine-5)-methyltransferase 1
MRHGSLFSGIGGFDLASEKMGWENVFHCEWNDFGQKVLKYYWPNAISYGDITQTDFTIHRGNIDILTGGFPCQPFSMAGKRKGTEDDRHLWPEMLRAIREIQPRWVVGENVFGLINWDGGLVFDQVQADLEAEGYEVQPYVLPACGVNAPHKRERIWFVAHSINGGYRIDGEQDKDKNSLPKQHRAKIRAGMFDGANNGVTPDTDSGRLERSPKNRNMEWQKQFMLSGAAEKQWWKNFPTQSPVCSGNDEFSSRLDGITFPKWRNESIRAYGNAIVPAVVHQIFKAIQQYES